MAPYRPLLRLARGPTTDTWGVRVRVRVRVRVSWVSVGIGVGVGVSAVLRSVSGTVCGSLSG